MSIDFTPFFEKYEELLKAADQVFEKVQNEFPDCVKCKMGCADCCHALFDLPLVEALYINHRFRETYKDREKEKAALIEKANRIDRQVYKIKKIAYKEVEQGRDEADILEDMAKVRVRCPLLNDEEQCDLYDYRPITCRFYGIPTAIGGKGHTCGKSAFKKGEKYPTVNLDVIQRRLFDISGEMAKAMRTKYAGMAEMLVPLSMALLTIYDDEYLGIINEEDAGKSEEKKGGGNE